MGRLLLGVVADDVTGACDLADAVCDAGLSAAVVLGRPHGRAPEVDVARSAPDDR